MYKKEKAHNVFSSGKLSQKVSELLLHVLWFIRVILLKYLGTYRMSEFFFSQNFRIDSTAQYNTKIVSGHLLLNATLNLKQIEKQRRKMHNFETVYSRKISYSQKMFLLIPFVYCINLKLFQTNLKQYYYKMWTFYKFHFFHKVLRKRFWIYARRKFYSYIDP